MKVGIKQILNDHCYGMPALHMHAIRQAAESYNTVIGIRTVSKYARTFIEDGYPTKPFAVKNKSSNTGIAAGLIAINPAYCQVPLSKYKEYTKLLDNAFQKDPCLQSIPCILPENRFNELQQLLGNNITIQKILNQNIYIIDWKKEETQIRVTARKIGSSSDYLIFDKNNQPLLVLGKTILDDQNNQIIKPITADYDLLVICPPYSDLNLSGKDKTPFPTYGCPRHMYDLLKASTLPNYIGPKEDTKGGNWSQRTREMITILNKNIAALDEKRKDKNNKIIHHNSEFHNPFANELIKNLPCLIVLPHTMSLSTMQQHGVSSKHLSSVQFILIETIDELKKLHDILYQKGYYWPEHANYPDLKIPTFETSKSRAIRY
ncbi:MAG: hypothetical protein KIT56_09630 [Gammaproteobacteria bacterium]|nr:hypothetical protein [Gammaproteobacteria bacterium]MCW5584113.1 hypothetical protein [Gammaproteobacteria bacterium]